MTKKELKKCGNCNNFFTYDSFYTQNKKYIKKDGSISIYLRLSYYCKKCDRAQSKAAKQKESYKKWESVYKNTREYKDRVNSMRKNKESYRIGHMLQNAKRRAKKYNVPFTLNKKDITIPEICPLLKVKLKWGTKNNYEHTPSLDRIDPTKGYTSDNVAIISKKANSMKNSATKKEMIVFMANMLNYLNINIEDIVRATENKNL